MKSRFVFSFFTILALGLCACDNKNFADDSHPSFDDVTNENFSLVLDEEIRREIFNYDLSYQLQVPGNNTLNYCVLWEGYDEETLTGTRISKENRLFTYLIDYFDDCNKFYAVYLKTCDIDNSKDWLNSYIKKHQSDSKNFHIIDNDFVVDCKYLTYAQERNINDYIVCSTNDISNIYFNISDYQLIGCLQSKTLLIQKNVSVGNEINEKINLLRRFELIKKDNKNSVIPYEFDGLENKNVRYVDNLFSYVGKRIESYSKNFPTSKFCYCPYFDSPNFRNKTIQAEINEKGVILPRFIKKDSQYVDLLDSNSNLESKDDVYRNHKNVFADAYLDDAEIVSGIYKYGFFDLDKVLTIINEVGNYDETEI